MLLSMTGFGKTSGDYKSKSYSIEIKSLNGKTSDIRLKIPLLLRNKEIELRGFIMERVLRGKIDVNINMTSFEGDSEYKINLRLFDKYFKELSGFAKGQSLEHQDFIQSIIRIPNVIQANEDIIENEEWEFVKALVSDCLNNLDEFRIQEGKVLANDIISRVNCVMSELTQVKEHEGERAQDLKKKLNKLITENLTGDTRIDQNRLEQELVYYLEKLDIHEEKIRLEQHCNYFLKIMNDLDKDPGKKLGFLTQELGREINTIGSKAQNSAIQRSVVRMKVELDQIREQLANVL